MHIWIMRHGEAGFNACSDSERQLTENGVKMAQKQGVWLAEYLNNQNIQLDKILVSPYVRAKQTLNAMIEAMQAVKFSHSFANIIEEWEEITPAGNPYTIENYLSFLREEGAKNILIVSHLPLVFDLVEQLTNYQNHAHFYPAVIAEVEWQGKHGSLIQTKTP